MLTTLHLADNRVAYNSLSREDSVDYDVSSPLARMESLRRDGGAETDTEVTAGSRKRVRVIKYHHRFIAVHLCSFRTSPVFKINTISQRYPTERPYFIAKEILMTERTYKKDLEILNVVS